MTVIIKSNKTFMGARSLGSLSALTRSAADIYATYAARVTADGGIIQDAAATLDAISKAVAGDYLSRSALAVSPAWGIKKAGANIAKFYSLNGGIDGIVTGAIDLDTTTREFPLAGINSGSKTIDFAGVNLLLGNALCVVESAYWTSGGSTFSFTAGGEAWAVLQYLSRLDIAGGINKFIGPPGYANVSLGAHAILVEMAERRTTGVLDGVQRKVMTVPFTPIPVSATANLRYTLDSGSSLKMAELWYLNDASLASVMALSYDLGIRR